MTRLADLGPLDRTRPHVYGAITPLARDLTTHLGKGQTGTAARVSAMMEAIERASAEESCDTLPPVSYDALMASGCPTVDPAAFTLPPDTSFTPLREIEWCPARRLTDGQDVLLAADLVLSPPGDGVIGQADTNGLASGNTLAEAILHAICELVERDAMGIDLFSRLYSDPAEVASERLIDAGTMPDSAGEILARVKEAGFEMSVFDMTRDIDLPVIAAYLVDPAFPGDDGPESRSFFGYGCAPSSERALLRALTEAEQSRVCMLQGARDSFNMVPEEVMPGTGAMPCVSVPVQFPTISGAPASEDLRDDLAYALDALKNAGFGDVYVADLTHPKLGMPVVRVRIPGLSVFLVDRSRIGSRDLACLL